MSNNNEKQFYRKLPSFVQAEECTRTQTIKTLEGDHRANVGDMIITGVEGERYPCKRRIFDKTYEPADAVCFCDICLDFDGVIHMYTSGWLGADVIPDPIVDGTIQQLYNYLEHGITISVYSARSAQKDGIKAMKEFINKHDLEYRETLENDQIVALGSLLTSQIAFPYFKPAAVIYLDDRGMLFRGPGKYPSIDEIHSFKPWYKKSTGFAGYTANLDQEIREHEDE